MKGGKEKMEFKNWKWKGDVYFVVVLVILLLTILILYLNKCCAMGNNTLTCTPILPCIRW